MPSRCTVCGDADAKYKCPRCRGVYCGPGCFKEHQKCSPPVAAGTAVDPGATTAAFATADTVPVERLAQLPTSAPLLEAVSNPHLRRVLRDVDASSDPERAMQLAMREPLFVEFADACLRVVQDAT